MTPEDMFLYYLLIYLLRYLLLLAIVLTEALTFFHLSHHVPVLTHVPWRWGKFLFSIPPAMRTLEARVQLQLKEHLVSQ